MAISFGVLSTYPPTQCGIATFSQSLVTHLVGAGVEVGVVRLVDGPEPAAPQVVHELVGTGPRATRSAAEALNGYDVALVQHEYGIFGGRDGDGVLDVLAGVRVPVVAVLHTVLTTPTPHQHRVLAQVVRRADAIVTMTQAGREHLLAGWDVDPLKVTVIAHGAEDNRAAPADPALQGRPTVLTWGLLGEGKGVEWALEAMAGLDDLRPQPLYRVVGETHPRVVEREGEAYRERLESSVAALGIAAMVEFDGRYLDGETLRGLVRDADVVLLPYDSREQVTSGVLAEAVAAGKPVVSTTFPHAVELLSDGAGLLVPQRDPGAIQAALRRVLTEPGLATGMAAAAATLATSLLWPAVAEQYVHLGHALVWAATAQPYSDFDRTLLGAERESVA